jgi:hypothetical protein
LQHLDAVDEPAQMRPADRATGLRLGESLRGDGDPAGLRAGQVWSHRTIVAYRTDRT